MSELLLLLVAAVLSGAYLVSCAVWPYTRCPVCAGGRHAREDGVVWRSCWRCNGKSRRRRFGAWFLGRGERP